MKEKEKEGFKKYRTLVITGVVFLLLGIGLSPGGMDTQFIPIVSGGGVNDHGLLNGLGDDDHTQYLLHTELDSEAELEAALIDVSDVYTNNDFVDNSANWNNAYTWSNNLYNTIGLSALTAAEVNQLENIGASTVSAAQWGYVGNLNQDLGTSYLVQFSSVDVVSSGSGYVAVTNTDTDSDSRVILSNDESSYYLECTGETNDKFKIVDAITSKSPFGIETGATQNNQLWLDNNGGIDIAGANPAYRLELPNTATNLGGRGNANRWDTYSDKRFKFDVSGLPEDYVITLCRLINWRIYKPIENWQDENGTIYKGDVQDIYCIGAYAQVLYFDIIEAFGNNSLARKIADNIVNRPEDEDRDYWTLNYPSIFMIYARGLQIADSYISENIEHTKHLESWAESLDDLLPTAYEFEPIPWN